jgi:ATP-dependent RNA helicase RhlE
VSFNNLKLIEPVLKALSHEGYINPTPIQQKSIPVILAKNDLLACAQTGTGKTAAFTIPLLQLMHEQQQLNVRRTSAATALILTPTRELAIQIGESFRAYGRFLRIRHTVIFGGVPQYTQVKAVRDGVEVLIATPGRLVDLVKQGHISLNSIKYFVLDEADRMLDIGFLPEIKRILSRLPEKKQTLLFSATMPAAIRDLANGLLKNPARVEVTPVSSTAEMIEQSVYLVEKQNKQALLIDLLKDKSIETVLVFTQMKHSADKLAKSLHRSGINAEAIHGNKSQNQRQQALKNFKNRTTRVLVATDIAARGIDIDELTHVVNYELPNVPETYVHRIGRTGRAGASGIAFSFCDHGERPFLNDIQKLIKKQIPVVSGHAYDSKGLHSTALPVQERVPNRMSYRKHARQRSGRTLYRA